MRLGSAEAGGVVSLRASLARKFWLLLLWVVYWLLKVGGSGGPVRKTNSGLSSCRGCPRVGVVGRAPRGFASFFELENQLKKDCRRALLRALTSSLLIMLLSCCGG